MSKIYNKKHVSKRKSRSNTSNSSNSSNSSSIRLKKSVSSAKDLYVSNKISNNFKRRFFDKTSDNKIKNIYKKTITNNFIKTKKYINNSILELNSSGYNNTKSNKSNNSSVDSSYDNQSLVSDNSKIYNSLNSSLKDINNKDSINKNLLNFKNLNINNNFTLNCKNNNSTLNSNNEYNSDDLKIEYAINDKIKIIIANINKLNINNKEEIIYCLKKDKIFMINTVYFKLVINLLNIYTENVVDNCNIIFYENFKEFCLCLNGNQIYDVLQLIYKCCLYISKLKVTINNIIILLEIIEYFIINLSTEIIKINSLNLILKIINLLININFFNKEESVNKLRNISKVIFTVNPFFRTMIEKLINSNKFEDIFSNSNFENILIMDNSNNDYQINCNVEDENTITKNKPLNITCEFKQSYNSLNINISNKNIKLIKETFLIYIKSTNLLFDGDATLNECEYLSNVFDQKDIPKILKKNDIELELRLEIIKFYRMTYIDIIIDNKSLDDYKNLFVSPALFELENDDFYEDNYTYKFFHRIIKINKYNTIFNLEFSIIKYELKYFEKIISSSNEKDHIIILDYIQEGIILPLTVFINKFMSCVLSLKGKDYIKLYCLVYYFLKLKKHLLENNNISKFISRKTKENSIDISNSSIVSNLFSNIGVFNNNKHYIISNNFIYKQNNNDSFYFKELKEINEIINMISHKNFEILNYKRVYNIFENQYKSFISKPNNKSVLSFFNKKETIYNSYDIQYMHDKLNVINIGNYDKDNSLINIQNNIKLSNVFRLKNIAKNLSSFNFNQFSLTKKDKEDKILNQHFYLDILIEYENSKAKLNESSFIKNLNEVNHNYNINYRQKSLNALFIASSVDTLGGAYLKESLWNIFRLLQNDTIPTQYQIYLIYKTVNLKYKFEELIKIFLSNLLSLIFSSSNPCSTNENNDYSTALIIVKIFKYLCEDHNTNFQTIFFQNINYEYKLDDNFNINNSSLVINNLNNKQTINSTKSKSNFSRRKQIFSNDIYYSIVKYNLFDLMVSIAEKIILISKWVNAKFGESDNNFSYFYDIFYAIIELCIEMIQGTTRENLNLLINSNGEINIFLNSFLCSIKPLLLNNDNDSEIVYKVRRHIVEFLVALIEEKSSPNKLILTISSIFNPEIIFKTIVQTLKKLYIKLKRCNTEYNIEQFNLKIFDSECCEYFDYIYFNNIEFSSKYPEFEFCKKLYLYVKLLANDYNHEEAKKFLDIENYASEEILNTSYINFKNSLNCNRKKLGLKNSKNLVHQDKLNNNNNNNNIYNNYNMNSNFFYKNIGSTNINRDNLNFSSEFNDVNIINDFDFDIEDYNNITDLNNKTNINYGRDFDASIFQNYYIVKFFERIFRTVYVVENNQTNRVVYSLNPLINYLSENTKNKFINNVNRESRYIKLFNLMEKCKYFYLEINYYSKKTKNNKILKLLNKIDYFYYEKLLFLITLLINIVMLIWSKTEIIVTNDFLSRVNYKNVIDDSLIYNNKSDNFISLYDFRLLNSTMFNNYTEYNSYILKNNIYAHSNYNFNISTGPDWTSIIVIFLASLSIILNILFIIFWMYSKYPLYYEIEKEKILRYAENNQTNKTINNENNRYNNLKYNNNDKNYKTIEKKGNLSSNNILNSMLYSFKNIINHNSISSKNKYINDLNSDKSINNTESNILNEMSFYKKSVLILYNSIFKKNQINSFIWNIFFSIIGMLKTKNYFFFSIQLLIIVNLSENLKNIVKSITFRYKQMFATTLFVLVVLYIFSTIAFFFLNHAFVTTIENNPENQCGTLLYCLFTHIDMGLRTDGGIGEYLRRVSFKSNSAEFFCRFLYDILFFFIIIVILLSIVFGIVIDNFAELKEQSYKRANDKLNICYICGASRFELEKDNIKFENHSKDEHYVWNYAYYIIGLMFVHRQDLNAINSYVANQIDIKSISWFPISIKNASSQIKDINEEYQSKEEDN